MYFNIIIVNLHKYASHPNAIDICDASNEYFRSQKVKEIKIV